MDQPSRAAAPQLTTRWRSSTSSGAPFRLGPLEPLGAAGKSLPRPPGSRGGEAAAALTAPSSRKTSKEHGLPGVSSGPSPLRTPQPQPTGRSRSTSDLFQKTLTQVEGSLSASRRRHSPSDSPAGWASQAALPSVIKNDCRPLPRRLQEPRSLGLSHASWTEQHCAQLAAYSLPRLGSSTDLSVCDFSATQAVSGFIGPPRRRATLLAARLLETLERPGPKPQRREEPGLGPGGARGARWGPSPSPHVSTPGPHAPTSEDTQEPGSHASAGEDAQQEPDDSHVTVPLAPTLREVYSRYLDDWDDEEDRFVRLAFKRFATDGVGEIARERLHDAFIHAGFLTSTRELALEVSAEFSEFHALDYLEFCGCVKKVATLERAAVRGGAGACLAEIARAPRCGAVALDRVQQFLRSAGVCMPYIRVEAARAAARLDCVRPEDMSTDDLLLTLAACKMREGFAEEEVAAAHEVFAALEQVLVLPVSSSGWGPQARASALLEGLLRFTGLYCMDYMDVLVDVLPSDSAEQPGVCFHEFLVWARRLRDPMMQDLWKCFRDFETSGSGVVQLDTAVGIAERFGISLLTDAVDELLSDLDMRSHTTLDFHALARFMGAARRTHGFSRSEREDLGAAFEKFDYDGTGELSHLQVLDLLRHLGITTNVDQANAMINRVDFNGNGSMDRDEFLRLMRLTREQDIRRARKSFGELSSSTGRLSTGSVGDALANLQLFPKPAMLVELLRDMPAEMCFTSFMRLYDQCRFRIKLEFQKHGGFPEDTLLKIEDLWNRGGSTRQFATVSELLWMLSGSHEIPVNTEGGRHALLRRVREAQEAAIATGVSEEVSREGTTDIGFYTFVHLIRGVVRDSEKDVVTREKEAVSLARLPTGVVADLRRFFCEFAELAEIKSLTVWNQFLAREGRPVDRLLARLTMVPAVPQSAVPLLLRSMGAAVPRSGLRDIDQFLAQSRSSCEADDFATIDFATFLRLLRWMLDADLAGICGVMGFAGR